MSSVSAACIFDAYSASSAHTDTFYIVPQIIRVRNSKRHFFSKLTFPYILQPLCFTLRPHRPQPPCLHPTATSTTTASPTPYGNIDHNRSAFTLRSHRPQPLRFTLRPHRPQPPRLHPTVTSTTTALPSPYGNIDHNRLAFALRQHRPQSPCLHPTATSTTTRHFAQQSRLNSFTEKISYFFKKALDKYPKTVYNVYCYLGVAQIGSALPWGGRGRRFKSCHSDQLTTA